VVKATIFTRHYLSFLKAMKLNYVTLISANISDVPLGEKRVSFELKEKKID